MHPLASRAFVALIVTATREMVVIDASFLSDSCNVEVGAVRVVPSASAPQ